MESIFSSLWKRKDIPEDFRTEILCWVLRNLDSQSLLNDFFKSLGISINKLEQPSIFTQHTSGVNRFDIIIKDSNSTIIFENKWDSPTDIWQLQAYDNYLQKITRKYKALVHITKDYTPNNASYKSNFFKLHWSHIYQALSNLSDDEITKEFLSFLEKEGIAMKKVSWEIINGTKSVHSLTRIIQRAAEELNVNHAWRNCASDYTAQCIDDKIYAYLLFKDSQLYFCVYEDKKPCEELSVTLWGDDHGIYFDFDSHYFFHHDLENQVEIIKSFINEFKSYIT